MHALDRLKERYSCNFTKEDLFTINTLIKKGLYLEVVDNFLPKEVITVLLRYNNIPMKLVYSKKNKLVITALPLDIEEYNSYYALVPEINTKSNNSLLYQENVNDVRKKFETQRGNKIFHHIFNLKESIKKEIKFYVRNVSEKFVILWYKQDDDSISYQVYSRKALQKKLWHFVIEGFRMQDSPLLKNTVLLYGKIYK